jgi:dephospho-CoA kinase
MLLIGITGGLGSGKSTVAAIFRQLGVPIYSADDRGKYQLNHDSLLIQAVKDTFGTELYSRNNELNRAALATIVFSDPNKLALLNALVHPAVGRDFKNWLSQQSSDYIIKESAILFETGIYQELDKIILVTAPEELRIQRAMQRDNSSEEAIRKRLLQQWPEERKLPLADFIINNDEQQSLIEQALETHHKIMDLCHSTTAKN